jgi:hypothetical protein
MDANFFSGAPDPAQDPMGYMRQQNMADQLRKQGMTSPQGTMAGGQYVAPSPTAYATQLASALAGGYRTNQLADAAKASSLLNGGTGQAAPGAFSKIGGWLGGMFSGGA